MLLDSVATVVIATEFSRMRATCWTCARMQTILGSETIRPRRKRISHEIMIGCQRSMTKSYDKGRFNAV